MKAMIFFMFLVLISCKWMDGKQSKKGDCDYLETIRRANVLLSHADLNNGNIEGDSALVGAYLEAALLSIDSAIECDSSQRSSYYVKLEIIGRMRDYEKQLKFLNDSKIHFGLSEFFHIKGLIYDSLLNGDSAIHNYLRSYKEASREAREAPDDPKVQVRLVEATGLLYGLDSALSVLKAVRIIHSSKQIENLYEIYERADTTLKDKRGILEKRGFKN